MRCLNFQTRVWQPAGIPPQQSLLYPIPYLATCDPSCHRSRQPPTNRSPEPTSPPPENRLRPQPGLLISLHSPAPSHPIQYPWPASPAPTCGTSQSSCPYRAHQPAPTATPPTSPPCPVSITLPSPINRTLNPHPPATPAPSPPYLMPHNPHPPATPAPSPPCLMPLNPHPPATPAPSPPCLMPLTHTHLRHQHPPLPVSSLSTYTPHPPATPASSLSHAP